MIWHPREGTTDKRIIQHVYTENGYAMPSDLRGKFVIDIGANIGTFAGLCAERGARVVAFEPEPSNYEMLRRHTSGLPIICRLMALGLDDGVARLWINDANTGGHSTTNIVGETSIAVRTNSLKTILSRYRCDILKLDCEGAEIFALPYLRTDGHERVPEIVCELHGNRSDQLTFAKALDPWYEATNIFQADWRFVRRPYNEGAGLHGPECPEGCCA